MQDYRKLWVWQKSHQLVLDVYADSAKYLRYRDAWDLKDQMRPAAISIPSNIAEGAGRGSDPDFRRFLFHSLGSTNELEYDFLLAKDLTFVPVPVYEHGSGRSKKFVGCYRAWSGNSHNAVCADSWKLEAGS